MFKPIVHPRLVHSPIRMSSACKINTFKSGKLDIEQNGVERWVGIIMLYMTPWATWGFIQTIVSMPHSSLLHDTVNKANTAGKYFAQVHRHVIIAVYSLAGLQFGRGTTAFNVSYLFRKVKLQTICLVHQVWCRAAPVSGKTPFRKTYKRFEHTRPLIIVFSNRPRIW